MLFLFQKRHLKSYTNAVYLPVREDRVPPLVLMGAFFLNLTTMTENEFNYIFDKYRMAIFNFVNKMLHDTFEAEEVTSLVFIKLWESQPKLETDLKTKAWLFISAKNRTFDKIKVNATRKKFEAEMAITELTEDDQLDIETAEIHAIVMKKILTIIKSYTKQEQIVFDLHFLKGLTAPEIGIILKTKPQTVHNQLTTLRHKLKAAIKIKKNR